MKILLFIFVILGLILIQLGMTQVTKKYELIKYTALSISMYFMIYVLITDMLFVFGLYSISKAVVFSSFVFIVILATILLRKGWSKPELISIKKEAYIIPALIFAGIIGFGSFQFYGMGQDEGVYQTEALNLYYGDNSWVLEIEDVEGINNEEYKSYYVNCLRQWLGTDLSYSMENYFLPGARYSEEYSVSGIWHGIPGFSSMIALSTFIFGIKNMLFINYIFYLSYVAVAGFILQKFNLKGFVLLGATLLPAICPVILWICKSSLSEMFFALMLAVFIYYVIDNSRVSQIASILPATTILFYHVSAFFLVPLYLVLFAYLYNINRNSVYKYISYLIPLVYFIAFLTMASIQPLYTENNYANLLRFVPQKQVVFVVLLGCFIALLVDVFIIRYAEYIFKEKNIKNIVTSIVMISILFSLIKIVRESLALGEIRMLVIVVYTVLTGVLLIPCIIAVYVFRKYELDKVGVILAILFCWCVMVNSIVLGKFEYYYYYARYIAPYILVVYLNFYYLMNQSKCSCKIKLGIMTILPIIAIVILFPFSAVIYQDDDDSKMEWEVLENILDTTEKYKNENGHVAVALDKNIGILLYYPLRAVADEVYLIGDDYNSEKLNDLGIEFELIVTENDDFVSSNLPWYLVYRQESVATEDDLSKRSKILGLPTEFDHINKCRYSIFTTL